ncbi:MAG TPA: chromosomal replication initiator protein DnaA [Planctomycetaceae bacterium]|nr:chromosomal replication initiator protein DnaA [Planctomycetaceae bacterium]
MQTGQAVMMPLSPPGGSVEEHDAIPPSRHERSGARGRTTRVGQILQSLEERVGTRSFAHWFGSQVAFALESNEFVVRVASPFFLNWMQKHFRAAMTAAASEVLGPSARVRFDVDGRLSAALDDEPARQAVEPADGDVPAARTAGLASGASGPRRRQNETPHSRRSADLADFVEGDCNRLALTAARQAAEAPGARFNPLYLHGVVGIGKTHLLEGIHGRLRRRFPALRVLLLTAEMFANHFTEALRAKTLPAFRQRFRGVDVLLVDDVDFFDGKRVIQEEFLHTFKQLESQHKQLVLTADRHPRLLLKSSDELTTRFLSGMVCRIEAPDTETRRQIVAARAQRLDVPFAEEALEYVAGRFRNNVRELEGALHCLATWHAMTGKRVSPSAARRVLADLERDCIRVIQPADVEATVCRFFGVRPEDLRSARRHRAVSQPRMLAMYLMRKHTHAAYTEIGRYFGGRNHATVMSAEKKVRQWVESRASIPSVAGDWPADELLSNLEQQLMAS